MAEKDVQTILKDALSKDNIIIGSREVVKALKMKKPELIILASNCPESIKKDINYYANMSGIKVETFSGSGKQLGIFCGKPFSISSIAISKKS